MQPELSTKRRGEYTRTRESARLSRMPTSQRCSQAGTVAAAGIQYHIAKRIAEANILRGNAGILICMA